jgi:hypothetical protein
MLVDNILNLISNNLPFMSNFCHDLPFMDHYGIGVHFMNLESINVKLGHYQVSDFLAFQFKLIYNWLNINRSLLDDGGVFPAIYEKEASPY